MKRRVYSAEELSKFEYDSEILGQFSDLASFSTFLHRDAPFVPENDVSDTGKRKNTPPNARNDSNGKDAVIEASTDDPGDNKARGNVLKNDTDKNGDKLTVMNDGKIEGEFGTLKLSANGKFVYTLDNADPDTDGLAAGEKVFDKFKYTVSDGHGGKDSALLKIKIIGQDDTPAASITLDPIAPDNVVNASEAQDDVSITGTVGGVVKDGDTVTLTVNGAVYTGKVNAGAFSIAVEGSDLAADADAMIDAKVTTKEGSEPAITVTDTQAYTVDTTPPGVTIAINAVTADNIVNVAEAGGDIAITGTVTNANNGDMVSLVINGKTFTGAVASGSFSIAVPGADLAADSDSTIAASLTTTDGAGNSATATDTQTYTVDATLPSGSILLNAVTADNVVNAAEAAGTVDVTGVVGGDFSNGDTVTLVVNGETYTGELDGGKFSIEVSGSDLAADSDKTIAASIGVTVIAQDTQGYSVDVTGPAATVTLAAVTADNIVNATEASGNISVTGTVGGDVRNGDTVILDVNGVSYTGSVNAGKFSISVLGSDLAADSDKTIAASVTTSDAAGNTTTASDTQIYTVDTTLPSSSIILNAVTVDNVVNADEASGNISVTGVVGGDFENGDTVSLVVNGKTVTGAVADGKFSIAVAGSDLVADTDKTVAVSVTTTDGAGNSVTASDTQAYAVDITPPSATIALDPIAGDDIVNIAENDSAFVAITGTVGGDVKDGDTVVLVMNEKFFTGTVSAGKFSINMPGFDLAIDSDTTLDVTVVASDAAGNTNTKSASRAYTLDLVAPTASLTLDPIAGDNVINIAEKNSAEILLTGTVGGDVKDGDTVQIIMAESIFTGTVTAGQFSVSVPGFNFIQDADVTLDASVSTFDAAGNRGFANVAATYAIDLSAPSATITLDPIAGDNIINVDEKDGGVIAITGTVGGDVKDGDTVKLLVNGSQLSGVVAAGKFSIDVGSANLIGDDDGTIQVNVSTSDEAGNKTTASASGIYTVDVTPPEASIALDAIAGDDILTDIDVFGIVAVSGVVGGEVVDGMVVTIEVNNVTYNAEVIQGAFAVAVNGADIVNDADQNVSVTVSVNDDAGNTTVATDVRPYTVNFDRDLTTLLSSQGFVVVGTSEFGPVGDSVSSVGDINGDGFSDIIIGSSKLKIDGSPIGGAFVVFGSDQAIGTADSAGRSVFDLDTVKQATGFAIIGESLDSRAGFSVSDAGDVNGDGFDDLLIGALGSNSNGEAGKAFVVFGTDKGFNNGSAGATIISLSTMTSASGFVIDGAGAGTTIGFSVSSAGDINGDGFDDLIVGAKGDVSTAGQSFVIFGTDQPFGSVDGAGRSVLGLATLSSDRGFVIAGDAIGDFSGYSVSSAGDVNGDGFDDLIVGAPKAGTNLVGEAYVVFGTNALIGANDGTRQVLDLTTLSATEGFVIRGQEQSANLAISVSSAGDINGDGFGDLVIGASDVSAHGTYTGEAYVVFGATGGFGTEDGGRQVIDIATLALDNGFVLKSDTAFQYIGFSVSSAGDVNGDGFDDLIVGGRGRSAEVSGKAFVLFGSDSGFGTTDDAGRNVVDLSALRASQGFAILGDAVTPDLTGRSVSAAGDVNGDGFDDLIVGTPGGNDGGADAGESYVVFGGAFGESLASRTITGDANAQTLIGGVGDDVLTGGGGADIFRAGAGNDTITISDFAFQSINGGGGGDDKVVFSGTGFTLDCRNFSNTQLSGIEAFDMTDGSNRLDLDLSDLFHFSTGRNESFTGATGHTSLVVYGGDDDILAIHGTSSALQKIREDVDLTGSLSGDFDFFDLIDQNTTEVLASIAVQNGIQF